MPHGCTPLGAAPVAMVSTFPPSAQGDVTVLVQAGLCLLPLVSQQKPAASSGQLPQLSRGLELQQPGPAMAAVGHLTISSSISEGSPRLCGASAALALSTALGTVCVKEGLAATVDATYLAEAASWALEVTNARHCGTVLRNKHLGAGVFSILSKEATQAACSDPRSC